MAHYIAEKMAAISTARGKARKNAQRECFDTILTLWAYQACFPYNIRPFKDFDSIFRAIAHIDPNKAAPSFFINKNGDSEPPKEIEQEIKFITNLDAAARIMISFFVRESILNATDKSTLEWLNAIKGIPEVDEVRIILNMVPELDDKDMTQNLDKEREKELSRYIDRLEAFETLSRDIKSALKTKLKMLETEH